MHKCVEQSQQSVHPISDLKLSSSVNEDKLLKLN